MQYTYSQNLTNTKFQKVLALHELPSTHANPHTRTHTDRQTHIYTHTDRHRHTHPHARTHTRTRMHTRTRTHTFTRKPSLFFLSVFLSRTLLLSFPLSVTLLPFSFSLSRWVSLSLAFSLTHAGTLFVYFSFGRSSSFILSSLAFPLTRVHNRSFPLTRAFPLSYLHCNTLQHTKLQHTATHCNTFVCVHETAVSAHV